MLKKGLCAVLVCLMFVVGTGMAIAQESVTIVVTINAEDQLVDEAGVVYEIVESEQGAALLENTGKKLKVIGVVAEEGDAKQFTVESFEVVAE